MAPPRGRVMRGKDMTASRGLWLPTLLLLAAGAAAPQPVAAGAPEFARMARCGVGAAPIMVDPFAISLLPTPAANGAAGAATLTFAQSPFGLSVTEQGNHRYDVRVHTQGLPPVAGQHYVAWAVTPSLDSTERLGTLGEDGTVAGQVDFNKFLLFVTAEADPRVERWSGPVVLRGISRSGRMHTMAGHGPFETEAC